MPSIQFLAGVCRHKTQNRWLLGIVIIAALSFGSIASVAEQERATSGDTPATITLDSDRSYCGGARSYSLTLSQTFNDLDIVSVSLYVEKDQQLTLLMPLTTTPNQGEHIVFCLPLEYAPFASVSVKYGQDSCGVHMNVFASKKFSELQPDIPMIFGRNL
ncbi:MAG: hypothetical protein V7459_03720 [Oceanicoccus sp.]